MDIHASSDVTVYYQPDHLDPFGRLAMLSLRELDENVSHIDLVKLHAVEKGDWHECPLLLAWHNELLVKEELSLDDETRIDLAPGERTDLLFKIPIGVNAEYFVFEINGYNFK